MRNEESPNGSVVALAVIHGSGEWLGGAGPEGGSVPQVPRVHPPPSRRTGEVWHGKPYGNRAPNRRAGSSHRPNPENDVPHFYPFRDRPFGLPPGGGPPSSAKSSL